MSTWTRRDVFLALNEAILDHIPAPRGIYMSEHDKPTAFVDLNTREDAERWARRFKLDETGPSFIGAYMGWQIYLSWRTAKAVAAALLTPDSDELPAEVTQ